MRRKIITTFALIFSLFLVGSGFSIYNFVNTTDRLQYLIGLHEIEDIRQELFASIQRVSSYVFASPEVLTGHLDEIVRNTNTMHNAIRRCKECHHEPAVEKELIETQQQVDKFEQQLSFLITIISDTPRRLDQQKEVYQASSAILLRVQSMVNMAAQTIDQKSIQAMNQLKQVYLLVGATLLSTLLLAFLVANYLLKSITGPIDALVGGTRKITGGQWGVQTDYHTAGEFQELIDSFNKMSEFLAQTREQEKLHLKKLQDTQKQLIEAEKLTALGTMAGGIAHDFNNILCGMIGHLNILAKQIPENNEHLETIDTIEKAGFRAADLVKQLLTFARQKPMEKQHININKCVNEAVQLIENTLDKRINLILELKADLPVVVGDASQLQQVIINLCVNARDAMPDGGNISLQTETFEPDNTFCEKNHAAQKQTYVLLTIRDTGCGINEKILPRIFDPFFTTKEVGKGTGLGLAMVYGIVQNHDGFCTINSLPGKGTTIKVYIPAGDLIAPEPSPSSTSSSPVDKTILIVDDEPMVVNMLQDYLESLGCKVLSAANGQIAVDIIAEKADEIDLVILDINMPVMCGRDAYQQFIRIKPDIKVLVSTGYIMNEETEEILDMGAQGFLQKPYKMEDINTKIEEMFSLS